jgi:hypothetical protein
MDTISAGILGRLELNGNMKEGRKRICYRHTAWIISWKSKLNSVTRNLYRVAILFKKLPLGFSDGRSKEKAVNSKLGTISTKVEEN